MRGACIAFVAIALSNGVETSVPFRTVARGAVSRVEAHRELVARTAGEWQVIWYKHAGSYDFPPIDFPRQMVVALFGGTRAAGADSVEIVSITRETDALVVRYREPHATDAQVPAQTIRPFHIIVCPAERIAVRFVSLAASPPSAADSP